MRNRAVKLASRPAGPIVEETFKFVNDDLPELDPGEVRVAIEYISLDPAMRTWIADVESYVPPVPIGHVMRAGAAGRIIDSNASDFRVGDTVEGMMGVQEHYSGTADILTKKDTTSASIVDYMGGLGGTGLAAYFGLLHVGEYRTGDTIVVSAAAGAVGHVVVQIAKLKGSQVIGIAGGSEKCRRVIELYGADECIDYKSEDVGKRMAELCPEGIDLYFDNVGGSMLEAALDNLAFDGRIVISGAIDQYDNLSAVHGPSNYLNLIAKRGTIRGLLNMHWADQFADARAEMAEWIEQGRLTFDVQIEQGLENFPMALAMLFSGRNTGKLLLKL